MGTRALFVALDAADRDLIAEWTADGHLPTFRNLEARALRGAVENPFGLYVGAVWPSFFTGLSPVRHGRYSFSQLVPGSYRTRDLLRHHVRGATFWSGLSAAGRRVAVIDVPKAPPGRGLANGIEIVDWGLHETEIDGGLWTSPPSLASEVLARYGPDPVGRCDLIRGRRPEYEEVRDRLLARIEIKARMIRDVLRESDWDLVLGGFADTHCAGHQLWHLHAGAAEADSPDALRDVYVAADRALGRLLAEAGDDAVCVVLASHGIGPYRGGNKILDDILRRLDGPAAAPSGGRRALEGVRSVWKRAPVGVKRALITLRQRTWSRVQETVLRGEFARRRYFAIPNNDAYGAIRLNVVGREPDGRVRPEEVDAAVAELERNLGRVIDLDTGAPAVRRVWRASLHYTREPLDDLPDLFVEWNGDRPIVRVQTPSGEVVEGYYPDYRTGDHRAGGAFWAVGPGITPGALPAAVSIMDFAPTFAELLGVSLPGLDGRPIPRLTASRAASAKA
jgi:predicted AlkP superfamily phosphohydrolase/phosphomutase